MSITIQKQGQRLYLIGDTFPIKDRIKAIGGHWDADKRAWWLGTAKESEARQLVDGVASTTTTTTERPKQNPDEIRVYGKGEYKGRTYFLGAQTRDGTRRRLLTLPNKNGEFLDFWADTSAVCVVKTYQPREYRGRVEYQTLGSLARFISKEKRNRDEGGAVCAECGRSGELVADLEDGMLKHYRCCDIPPD